MNWNRFCFYGLMCFLKLIPRQDPDPTNGLCSYYSSDDVNRTSLVIDASKQGKDPEVLRNCVEDRLLNTILIHAPEDAIGYQPTTFTYWSLEYDHLIVLNNAMPQDFCPRNGRGSAEPTSLTVYKNNNLPLWTWLECTKFKHIRIDDCFIQRYKVNMISKLIFSERLLTLTLIRLEKIYPLLDLDFTLAPNLRELSINHFIFGSMRKANCNGCFMQLKKLNLENNMIIEIRKDFFSEMPMLQEINLGGNQLKSIDFTFKTTPRRLVLDNNPLVGDKKLCKFLRSAPFAYYGETDKICQNMEHDQESLTQG